MEHKIVPILLLNEGNSLIKLLVHKGYKSMETVVKNGGPQWPRA